MDVNEAIYQRRAVRRYTEQPVNRLVVMELIRAATQAPSALNLQPWAFAVFHDRALLDQFSKRAKEHLLATLSPTFELHPRSQTYAESAYDVFHGAGTVVVIYATGRRFNPTEDCCMAAQNFMLAAHALGLATCPVGFARSWFDLPEMKRELGVPENYMAVFPMVVGYPEGSTGIVPRKEPEIAAWKWTGPE